MRVSRVPQASSNGGRKLIVRRCYNYLPAVGKSEGGLDGVVGGMTVIVMLAGTMRRGRDGIAAAEDDMRQTYTVKHIQTLFILSRIV